MCSFICYFLSTVGGLHAFFTLVNTYVLCFINWVSLPSCTVCSPTLPISVTVRLTLSPKGNFQSCLGYIPIYLVDGCFDSLFLFKKKKSSIWKPRDTAYWAQCRFLCENRTLSLVIDFLSSVQFCFVNHVPTPKFIYSS